MSPHSVPAFAPCLPVPTTRLVPQVSSRDALRSRSHVRRATRVAPPPQSPAQSHRQVARACASPASPAAPSEPRSPFPVESASESLFATYSHPAPSGTAALARERGVALAELSAAYGHILAGNIRADIPLTLNRDLLVSAVGDGLRASGAGAPVERFDTARLGTLVSRACDPAANGVGDPSSVEKLSPSETDELSTLYGTMLATTLHLSAFELDVGPLCDALDAHLQDEKLAFPMERDAYDAAFSDLQSCATEVLGTAAVDAADTYFKEHVVQAEGARDVQGDGYIVSFQHAPSGTMPSDARAITIEDAVSTVMRARLLDGRCIVDGTIPENEEDGVLLKLDNIPLALASTLVHQSPGDTLTVFYHPYAAHEVLPLFLTPDQIPPQSGMVLDIHVLSILKTSQ